MPNIGNLHTPRSGKQWQPWYLHHHENDKSQPNPKHGAKLRRARGEEKAGGVRGPKRWRKASRQASVTWAA